MDKVLSGYSCLILGLCLTHIALSQKKDTSVAVGVEASKNGVDGTITKKEFDNLSAVVINDCFRGSL
ncbi:hypothetical protein MAR_031102 [Mya arenaria]|uniref:Uncharacterized protein n=1 Tax=Mya arenaria TaxID=6604 RepID=A0ABY7F735_MYAAR|nr:hypothetical protein MAR_031102 [Mya arenaria]